MNKKIPKIEYIKTLILKPDEGHLVETRRNNLIFIRKELEERSLEGPFCRILVKHIPDTYFDPTRLFSRNFDYFIN
ncbi:hypothetical protein BpHYR1_021150 [Brachionus plicatilis]|uniref:Uncharacterized protein n=1 Tax=Brachionus plicatilis TaxID=10195 RepID=A0A3M7PLZ4_BRAPC|nr:hypothetical protein BpHYR1_021150 [Brachionus plicatilis]